MRQWGGLFVLVLLVSVLSFFAPSAAVSQEKPTILRLAHVVPATSTKNLANLKFSELVQSRTKSQVQVQRDGSGARRADGDPRSLLG
ncbi:MAG: hypothetical protein HYV46_10495 [candidate division NC10 bacterium]|nr:hypothetical protein [candidate division NC10 bacterium]